MGKEPCIRHERATPISIMRTRTVIRPLSIRSKTSGFNLSPYMVSSRFARSRVVDDRDRIASVYPAC